MGKTPKPLVIEVSKEMGDWDEIKTLEAQGHTIWIRSWEATTPDIVMGSNCWRMDEAHRKYLDLAITEARRVRYPKKDADAKK